jgi:hypothetical protein
MTCAPEVATVGREAAIVFGNQHQIVHFFDAFPGGFAVQKLKEVLVEQCDL